MKRSARALILGLVVALFLLAGTGAAFAYGSGNGWTWCGGTTASGAGTAANAYRCAVGGVVTGASTTVASGQVVSPSPGPGWCWDAARGCWVAPQTAPAPGATTVPTTTPPAAAPGTTAPSSGGTYTSGGCGCCW